MTKYYRNCKSCFYDESCTSGTLFHKIKFSIVSAFEIIYWLIETKKGMSTVELYHHFGINQSTAWKFKKKIQLATSGGSSSKMTGSIEVAKFVVGGKKKKAQGLSLGKKQIALLCIETMPTSKEKKGIRRAFCQSTDAYSSEEFKPFFEKRIEAEAKVRTSKWTGYSPLKQKHKIRMVYSKTGNHILFAYRKLYKVN